MHLLRC